MATQVLKVADAGTLYDVLSKPVPGETARALGVGITASRTEPELLTNAPLAAGAQFKTSWLDCRDGRRIGLFVQSDTVCEIRMDFAPDAAGAAAASNAYSYRIAVNPTDGVVFIPPIRVAPYARITVVNPTGTNQTTLAVYAAYYYGPVQHSQNLRITLIKGFAPRDTAKHSPFFGGTDAQTNFPAGMEWLGDGTHPVFYSNATDQQVSVNIVYSASSTVAATLGTFTVAAGATALKTNQDFPGLDIPTRRVFLETTASVAPTTGDITAYLEATIGG